jgi:hypothetical protein
MATLDDIKKLIEQLKNELISQLSQRKISAKQVLVSNGLSDISERLGLIQSGEFRSGNSKEPGQGFSGVRIGYPAFVYDGDSWNIVGINNDDIQFGLSAENGRAYFAGGQAYLGADAFIINGLTYPIQQTATNSGYTRIGKMGMIVPYGSSVPAFQLSFEDPPGDNLLTNGDAESGSTTGWTDASSAWSVSTTSPYAGTYSFKHDETNTGCPANFVQNVGSLTAGNRYAVSFASKTPNGDFTPNVILIWKTSGSVEISRDICYGSYSASWNIKTQAYPAPATCTNVDVVLSPGDSFGDAYFDSVSFYAQSVGMYLTFTPHLRIEGGSFVVGNDALSTSATDGFLYIPTCAGTPTGAPTTQTGTAALVYDTTNNKLYVYDGSWIDVT